MRLTFIPADKIVIFNGIAAEIDLTSLDVPEHLHAIQHYSANDIECEWTDSRGALGNSEGVAGLTNGIEFINELVNLHTKKLAQIEAEKERVLEDDENAENIQRHSQPTTYNDLLDNPPSIQCPKKATTDAINGVSDIRDKSEVQDLSLGLDIVMGIEPITFKLNKREWYENDNENNETRLAKDSIYTGFSAQQLKQLFEEKNLSDYGIVKNYRDEYPTISEEDDNTTIDRLYVEHNALLPFLVNSIKQQQNQIQELRDEIKRLSTFHEEIQ